MKRSALIGGLVALVGSAVAVADGSAVAVAPTPPRAHLRGLLCQTALEPAQRIVSVQVVMRPLPGTQKLAVRFDLLSRTAQAGAFAAILGGDLGKWISPSNPTLGQRPDDVWVVSHPVADVPAPATYRFRVEFRWAGARGRVLGTQTRQGPSCFQPELRPDLVVQSIVVQPIVAKPMLNQYVALIRNGGATGAGPFDVRFTPAGSLLSKTHTIQRLGPHATRQVTFVGPACTAATAPTVTADPAHVVADDLNPLNNSLTVPSSCPAVTRQ